MEALDASQEAKAAAALPASAKRLCVYRPVSWLRKLLKGVSARAEAASAWTATAQRILEPTDDQPTRPSLAEAQSKCDPTAECAPAVRPLEHVAAQALPPPPPPSSPDTATSSASIVLVYGFYRDRVRTWYTADPMRSYLNAMRLMFRLVLSLQRVRTTLPIHLLPSGDR